MGNTDIVTAPLSDANEKNTTEHSTIFDDVFRTIAQKMPQLLIPLINEVFHTSYSEEDHLNSCGTNIMKNLELWSRILLSGSATIFIIWSASPQKTKRWSIRMFEYDISIAIEHASFESNDIWEIEFPQSCVLYIRNHRSLPDFHEAIVKFADGQKVRYRIPIIQAKKYTVDRIFEKRLLILLPYHILRYEHF